MSKRTIATILWFLAGWALGGLALAFTDLPSALSLIPGVAMGALVRWDPAGLLWTSRDTLRRVPINDLADELSAHVSTGDTTLVERSSTR